MTKWLFLRLAKLFHATATFCEKAAGQAEPQCKESTQCKESQCDELCSSHCCQCQEVAPAMKARISFLLSLDRLSEKQEKELDELTSNLGDVIFLDGTQEKIQPCHGSSKTSTADQSSFTI